MKVHGIILNRLGEKRTGAEPLHEFDHSFSLDGRFSPNSHVVAAENPSRISFINIPLWSAQAVSPSLELLLHGGWQYAVIPRDLTQGRDVKNVNLTLTMELPSLAHFLGSPETPEAPKSTSP